jgi:hypothetical protein
MVAHKEMNKESRNFEPMAHRKIGMMMMQDTKLMDILKDYHVVRLLDQEDFNTKLSWCLEHCQHKFRDIREDDVRAWYFQNSEDATMFAMKWS